MDLTVKKYEAIDAVFRIRHYKILDENGKYWLHENQKFDNISHLMEYFQQYDLDEYLTEYDDGESKASTNNHLLIESIIQCNK